jgi:hypothetical protein
VSEITSAPLANEKPRGSETSAWKVRTVSMSKPHAAWFGGSTGRLQKVSVGFVTVDREPTPEFEEAIRAVESAANGGSEGASNRMTARGLVSHNVGTDSRGPAALAKLGAAEGFSPPL